MQIPRNAGKSSYYIREKRDTLAAIARRDPYGKRTGRGNARETAKHDGEISL